MMQPSPSRKRTIDQVSPSNLGYASTSPIPTAFSPAAMAAAGGLSGVPSAGPGASPPMGADSPFTSALNQGSRMLSGIGAPTPSSTALPTGYDPRNLSYNDGFGGGGQAISPAQLQVQMQVQNGSISMDYALQQMANMTRQQQQLQQQQQRQKQQIKPEVALKISIDSLLEQVLPALERDGDAFYDAIEGSLASRTDSRLVQAKQDQLLSSLSGLVQFLQAKGLASLPLVDPSASKNDAPEPTSPHGPAPSSAPPYNPMETLAKETAALQELAREMFERRARLREAAGIITGILDDDWTDAGPSSSSSRTRKATDKCQTKKTSTMAADSAARAGGASTPAIASTTAATPSAATAVGTPAASSR